jgi:hypothetical protein
VSISQRKIHSPAPRFVFHLGPFRFESEIDIPELRTSAGPGEKAVTIRLGAVPASLSNAIRDGDLCQITPTECLLDIPGTARYYVRNGNEVRLQLAPDAPAADVSTYLLGSVFGVLCHQNGMLPLHASAIECAGAVTAFLGDSGAGKSTLAASLQRRGHRIVADDICLIDPDSDSEPLQVVPVAGWLKLWSEALQHLGETPVEQNRVFSTDDKFRIFLPPPLANSTLSPLRLARVVFLARSPDLRSPPSLELLPVLHAIAGLMEMTYAGYVPSLGGQKSRLFQRCAGVLRHAQAFRLTLPWGLDRIDSVLDLLETDLLGNTSKSPH